MGIQALELGSVESLSAPKSKPQIGTKEHDYIDKGYAWVVMFAVFGTIFFECPLLSASTLVYQQYQCRFNLTAAEAGGIVALPDCIRYLSSPFIGILFNKFTHRSIGLTGSVLFTAGVLCFGFAKNLWMLYAGSVLYGLGGNMVLMPAFVIIPAYFVRNRALAAGITSVGVTIGFMIHPLILSRTFDYLGYTQTFTIVACLTLQTAVTAALYRPQPVEAEATEALPDKTKWEAFKEASGLGLLKRPILLSYMLAVASIHCMFGVGIIFVSGLAFECANMSSNQVATLLSIAAFSSGVSVPVGFCFDIAILRPHRVYLFAMYCLGFGILGILMTLTTDKISFTVIYTLFFASNAAAHSQYVTILGDIVELDELPKALGLVRVLLGIVYLLGPMAAGKMKDVWDSFQYAFIVMSVVNTAMVIVFLVVYFCWRRSKDQHSGKVMVDVNEKAEEVWVG